MPYQFNICEVLLLEVRSRLRQKKRHPCGCLICKSPVGQPSGFYIFRHLQTLRAHPANL